MDFRENAGFSPLTFPVFRPSPTLPRSIFSPAPSVSHTLVPRGKFERGCIKSPARKVSRAPSTVLQYGRRRLATRVSRAKRAKRAKRHRHVVESLPSPSFFHAVCVVLPAQHRWRRTRTRGWTCNPQACMDPSLDLALLSKHFLRAFTHYYNPRLPPLHNTQPSHLDEVVKQPETIPSSRPFRSKLRNPDEDQGPPGHRLTFKRSNVPVNRRNRPLSDPHTHPFYPSSTDSADLIKQPETRPISQEQLVAEVKGAWLKTCLDGIAFILTWLRIETLKSALTRLMKPAPAQQ